MIVQAEEEEEEEEYLKCEAKSVGLCVQMKELLYLFRLVVKVHCVKCDKSQLDMLHLCKPDVSAHLMLP